jgi:hypothetical protein
MPSSGKGKQHLLDSRDLLRIARTIEWDPVDTKHQYYYIQTINILLERCWGEEPIIAAWQRVPWTVRNTIGFAIQGMIDMVKNVSNDFTVFAYDLETLLGWPHYGRKE